MRAKGKGEGSERETEFKWIKPVCPKSFVSCYLPGVTFTAVFCVPEDLARGPLQSQHEALHLLGISLSSWKRVQEPNTQDRETPLVSLMSFLLSLSEITSGVDVSSITAQWVTNEDTSPSGRFLFSPLASGIPLFFGPGTSFFSWAAKVDVCTGGGGCKQGWGSCAVNCPFKHD